MICRIDVASGNWHLVLKYLATVVSPPIRYVRASMLEVIRQDYAPARARTQRAGLLGTRKARRSLVTLIALDPSFGSLVVDRLMARMGRCSGTGTADRYRVHGSLIFRRSGGGVQPAGGVVYAYLVWCLR